MIRPPERLKAVASQLATLLGSQEGSGFLRLIAQLAEPEPDASEALREQTALQPVTGAHPAPTRVGIWESRIIDGEEVFVREQTGEPWHLWAYVQRISPKRNKQRIVFVGESVARGYLYDPDFNPAAALQNILRTACASDSIEVVDLARTDLSIDKLEELVQASLALAPDVLVVFAGNNWHPISCLRAEELYDISMILRGGGSWQAVKSYIESTLCASVDLLLQDLGKITEIHGIPVVFILPEFNLVDWRSKCDSPPLVLGGDATSLWLSTREEAEHHLASGEWEKARTLGWKLIEMDGGTTPVGPNIIVEAKPKHGGVAGARKLLEMARDASVCWPLTESPRCYSVIQQTIRSKADIYGIRLVDLPRRFEEYLDGDLPGRRLFLDYCHMNLEGIKVSMALTAEALLPLLHRPERRWKELSRVDLKVSRKVAGEAHFLAAVHNSNWGQSQDIVGHHCREAIKTYPEVAQMMKLFLDFHIRRAPSSLCKTFDDMCQLQSVAALNLLFNDSMNKKFLNANLITELTAALQNAGDTIGSLVDDLIRKEHAVNSHGVDLLDKVYSTVSFLQVLNLTRYAFHRAASRCSRFRFVCNDSNPVHFTLTQRVPGAVADQFLYVWINGVCVYEHAATSKWTTAAFSTQAGVVRPGFNYIEIHWPIPGWSDMEWRRRTVERLEAGEMDDVISFYGDIHSFRVFDSALPEMSL